MPKFDSILVYQEGTVIYARGESRRVLFRFNSSSQQFGLFRSSRMTDEEMEFCLMMAEKYVPTFSDEDRENCIKFMKYEIDRNIFCS